MTQILTPHLAEKVTLSAESSTALTRLTMQAQAQLAPRSEDGKAIDILSRYVAQEKWHAGVLPALSQMSYRLHQQLRQPVSRPASSAQQQEMALTATAIRLLLSDPALSARRGADSRINDPALPDANKGSQTGVAALRVATGPEQLTPGQLRVLMALAEELELASAAPPWWVKIQAVFTRAG